jgi:upstream activation factor subunit UAF30
MPSKAKQSTTATKDAPAKTASAKDASAKKVNPALMRPLQPSQELAAVVGSKPLPRAEVVSKVWDYIKKNNLQDPQNKREIVADEKLQAVFGKNRVTMFEMNKHLAQHLT